MASEQHTLAPREYLSTVRKIILAFYPRAIETSLPHKTTKLTPPSMILDKEDTRDVSVYLLHLRLPEMFEALSVTILRLVVGDESTQRELLRIPVEPALLFPSLPLIRVRGERKDAAVLTSGRDPLAVLSAWIILATLNQHRYSYRG